MALLLLLLLDKICFLDLFVLSGGIFQTKQAVDRHQLVAPSSRGFYLTSISSRDAMFFCSFILSAHYTFLELLFCFVSIVPNSKTILFGVPNDLMMDADVMIKAYVRTCIHLSSTMIWIAKYCITDAEKVQRDQLIFRSVLLLFSFIENYQPLEGNKAHPYRALFCCFYFHISLLHEFELNELSYLKSIRNCIVCFEIVYARNR